MKVKSDGSVEYETREELIETAWKNGFGLYMVRYHRDLKELVLDLSERGISTSIFPQYFDFVVFPDGRIVEIVGVESPTGELITNTMFCAFEALSGNSAHGASMASNHRPKQKVL